MSLPGKVIKVNENNLIVEVSPKPECDGCHACKGLLGDEKKSSLKQITALKGDLNPKIGDEVILDTNPGEGSIAALIVFGFPMFSFFLGLFTTPYILQFWNINATDGYKLIFGLFFLFIAFIILNIFSRSKTAKKLTLKVIEIVDE